MSSVSRPGSWWTDRPTRRQARGSGHHDHCTALTFTSAWNGTDFYLLLSLFSICVLSNQSLRSVLSSRVNPSRVSSPARHGCSGHTRCTRVYHVRYSARNVKPFHQNEMTRTDNTVWHIFWSDKVPRGAGQAWVDGCAHGFHTEVRSLIRASLVTPSTQEAVFFATRLTQRVWLFFSELNCVVVFPKLHQSNVDLVHWGFAHRRENLKALTLTLTLQGRW